MATSEKEEEKLQTIYTQGKQSVPSTHTSLPRTFIHRQLSRETSHAYPCIPGKDTTMDEPISRIMENRMPGEEIPGDTYILPRMDDISFTGWTFEP